MIYKNQIGAVIVTFNPSLPELNKLVKALTPQVERIVIVDNCSFSPFVDKLLEANKRKEILFIQLTENKGIAEAQNIGIGFLKEENFAAVVLFDQDSIPEDDMVSRLVDVLNTERSIGRKIAAVGPRYFDKRQPLNTPFIQVRRGSVVHMQCTDANTVFDVEYLIASGCLIPINVIDDVGLMDSSLFIDYVDIEWGLRAKVKGYQSLGVCSAFMQHSLGDSPIKFMGHSYPARSPLRHYYLFRNAIHLYKKNSIPAQWKYADAYRLLLKYGFYILFAKPRWLHWWMMSKGIFHGLIGKKGKL